jgi:hypothetical protein
MQYNAHLDPSQEKINDIKLCKQYNLSYFDMTILHLTLEIQSAAMSLKTSTKCSRLKAC